MRVPSYAKVDTVEVEGGRFDLAPVPEGVWRGLALQVASATRAAKRRALFALKESGDEISEGAVTELTYLDGVYRNELEVIKRESVAWCVRGHVVEGLPFVAAEREFFGRRYPGASDETVRDYADTRLDRGGVLLDALYVEVSRKNSLSPVEKKSSGPPSETTAGAGDVTTA